jgi:hypothetical protein
MIKIINIIIVCNFSLGKTVYEYRYRTLGPNPKQFNSFSDLTPLQEVFDSRSGSGYRTVECGERTETFTVVKVLSNEN